MHNASVVGLSVNYSTDLVALVQHPAIHFQYVTLTANTGLRQTAEDVDKVLPGRTLMQKHDRASDIEAFYHRHERTLAMLSALPGTVRCRRAVGTKRFLSGTSAGRPAGGIE